MVDALKDAWRVVVDRGTLLDLRPRPLAYRLELVTADDVIRVGYTDTAGRAQDDAAADAAVALVSAEGLFAPRSRVEFDTEIVWDDVSDLKSFVTKREGTRVTPSYDELERAYRTAARDSNARPRLRAGRRIVLSTFDRMNRGSNR